MSEIKSFDGFPEAGLQFLRDIADNNNKEWFQANRPAFDEMLVAPAQSFVVTLGRRLQEIDSQIVYDTSTNGRGVLMRFYRDTRFSEDKSPYKTNIAGMFTDGMGKKTNRPSFGFHMGENSMELMAGMFKFTKEQLTAYRQAVDSAETGSELASTLHDLGQRGDFHVVGEHYKRVPREYHADHPRGDLLRYAGLYVHPTALGADYLTSPKLVDVCFNLFNEMAPVYHWLSHNVAGG